MQANPGMQGKTTTRWIKLLTIFNQDGGSSLGDSTRVIKRACGKFMGQSYRCKYVKEVPLCYELCFTFHFHVLHGHRNVDPYTLGGGGGRWGGGENMFLYAIWGLEKPCKIPEHH